MKASTAWKVSKYGVLSGPYFPAFGLNTGKYGPEITPHLDTFHALLFANLRMKVSSISKEIWHNKGSCPALTDRKKNFKITLKVPSKGLR